MGTHKRWLKEMMANVKFSELKNLCKFDTTFQHMLWYIDHEKASFVLDRVYVITSHSIK